MNSYISAKKRGNFSSWINELEGISCWKGQVLVELVEGQQLLMGPYTHLFSPAISLPGDTKHRQINQELFMYRPTKLYVPGTDNYLVQTAAIETQVLLNA
jgi:hypothetical protein